VSVVVKGDVGVLILPHIDVRKKLEYLDRFEVLKGRGYDHGKG